jgi:uncharacterized protein (DUF2141 family)
MRSVLALLVALASVASATAQQRDRPAAPAPPAGTGLISGVLTTAAGSTTPVRRAIVSLISGDGLTGRSVVTDDQGAFVFRALPPGRYTLTAQKAAHLKNNYGAKRPGRPGSSIVLTAGQQLTGLNFSLPPGGVIAGTLRLESGEPMPNTQVLAIPIEQATTGGRYTGNVEFVSDDQGAFRIYGLTPGTYLLAALPSVGRGEVETRTEAQYEAIARQMTQAAARPIPIAAEVPTEIPDLRGYAPTYFPGTPVVTNATPITVAAGEVKDGVDIPITMFRMSTVSGTIIGTDGRPAQAVQLSAEPIGPPLPFLATSSVRANRPDAQGRFTMSNMPPGSYRIIVRAGGVTLSPDGATSSISTSAQTEWATTDVQVSGENIDGISLVLQPGLTFEGQVAMENGPPGGLKGANITIQPVNALGQAADSGMVFLSSAPRSASVQTDGSFKVAGIQPGRYDVTVRAPGLGATWVIRSIVAGGRDVRDAPLTFEQGSISGATITLSNQRSEVAGTLTAASGVAAGDHYVVIFASDKSLWHPTSPRVRMVRPGADGAFSVRDLPAGDYRIAALTDVEDSELRSPAFLASLIDASLAVVVRDGEITRQDIRIK